MLLKEEVVKKVKEWQSKFVTPAFVSVRMRAEAEPVSFWRISWVISRRGI